MQREQAKQELAGWLLKELDEQARRERIAFWFFCGFISRSVASISELFLSYFHLENKKSSSFSIFYTFFVIFSSKSNHFFTNRTTFVIF